MAGAWARALRLAFAWTLAWLLLAPRVTWAAPPALVLGRADRTWNLGDHAEWLLDDGGKLTLGDVQTHAGWQPVGAPRKTVRLPRGVLWLRVVLRDASGEPHAWRVDFDHPRPIELTSYLPDSEGVLRARKGGMVVPLEQRDVVARAVVVPLRLPAGREVTAYFRLDTTPLGFSAVVGSAEATARKAGREEAVLGVYYGIAAGLFLYNLFLLIALRDRTYGWYLIVVFTTVLFFLGRNGFFFERGWTPQSKSGSGAIVSLQVVGILQFTRGILRTDEALPRIDRILRACAGVFFVTMFVALLVPGTLHEMRVSPAAGLVVLVVLAVGAVRLWQGSPLARYYMAAWGLFLGGALLYLAKSAGAIAHTALTEHAMQVGSALEMVLLSLALAHRIRTMELEARAREHGMALERVESARKLEQTRAESAARILEAQDEHSRVLARDLHDSVGHRFALIERAVGDARDDDEALEAIAAMAREGMAETREIAHGLYPQRLLDVGLAGALQAAADALARAGLAVDVEVDEDLASRLTPARRLSALRVVEEALGNVLRHAGAKRVRLVLAGEDGGVMLSVADDGRGFGDGAAGLGTTTMRDRAEQAGGRLAISSEPGAGTRVEVWLPLERGNGADPRSVR